MAVLIVWSLPAEARDGSVSISARTLPQALAELSREEGISIGAEGALPHSRTPRISNAASVADALARLLVGTGLEARQVGPSAWRIERQRSRPNGAGERNAVTSAPPAASPIVVTATKRSLSLADVPFAVSVVDLSDGEDSNPGRDSAWAVGRIDGVALSGQGPGRNRMFLHGVADSPFNGDSQSTVAVLLDDSRLTYSAPDPDIRLVDVERVEVLKGPQGALYGTGALGGIYRIVTRRPDSSHAAVELGVDTQALVNGQLGASASAMVNLPVARDIAALRLVAYGGKEPGWVDTGSNEDSNSGTVLGLRGALGIEAGSGWTIDATGFGQWLNSADSSYVYASGARSRPTQLPEPHDNDLRHLAVSARRDGAFDITIASGMTWHEVRDRYDATVGADSFGLGDPALLDEDREYRTWDSELRLTAATGAVDWLAGLSHVEARQESMSVLTSRSNQDLTLQQDDRVVSDSALFGEATLAVSDELDVVAGARLFRTHVQDERQSGASDFEFSRTRLGATPSLALSWQPDRGTLVYLRYGSAFRQGGTSLTSGGQPRALDGDELATVEAGWRQAVAGGTFDLGAYYSRWENVQSDMLDADGLLTTRNAGDARIVGAEASFSGSPAPGWTVDAGASWQSGLLVRNETGVELDDRRLPAVPEYALRATVERKWMVRSAEAKAGLNLRYVGPARLSFQPELDLPMGDYLESSLTSQVRFDRLLLGLEVRNLFGLKADTFPFGNPLRAAALIRQYTPQRPSSISLSVAFAY